MVKSNTKGNNSPILTWRLALTLAAACLLAALIFSFISTRFSNTAGWISFFIVTFFMACLSALCWRLLNKENPPRRLGTVLIAAVLLRMAVGAFLYIALPIYGHASPLETSGYVMADAGKRDQAAYQLAETEKPLYTAFITRRGIDQYGGMLFISAFVYRYAGEIDPTSLAHYPLLIVIITAFISSLAVLFIWAFTNRLWGMSTGMLAASILMVYPEAVLLGSSQMREGFTITLTVIALYGLVRFFQERTWVGAAWMLLALTLSLPLSPPYAALLLVTLFIAAVPLARLYTVELRIHKGAIAALSILVIACITAGLWLSLRQFTPEGMSNPIAMLEWWFRKSSDLQTHLTKLDSGWTQKALRTAPGWIHLPLILVYGSVQPFLPAALIAGTHAKIWQIIAIWRALGWFLLFPVLVYAFIPAIKTRTDKGLALVLNLLVLGGILIAAFRSGGDLWDNPRYRAAFVGLQVAVVSWAIITSRRTNDRWLKRIYIGLILFLVWFLPWYLFRYYGFNWPVTGLYHTIGLGLVTALIYLFFDWFLHKPVSK
jgi:hypothetical protein